MPTHSLVAAESPEVKTIVASGLLPVGLVPCFLHLELQTTGGSSPYRLCECRVLCSVCLLCQNIPVAMIFCLSDRPRLFPGLPQICHTSPLRVSSRQSTPVLFLISDPQSMSLSSKPPLAASVQVVSWLGSALHKLSLSLILSSLPLDHLSLCSPLRFPSSPDPICEQVSKYVETFPASRPPSEGSGLLPEICCPFFFFFFNLYLLPYLILMRLAWLLGSLGSSAIIQKVFCSCSTCR